VGRWDTTGVGADIRRIYELAARRTVNAGLKFLRPRKVIDGVNIYPRLSPGACRHPTSNGCAPVTARCCTADPRPDFLRVRFGRHSLKWAVLADRSLLPGSQVESFSTNSVAAAARCKLGRGKRDYR